MVNSGNFAKRLEKIMSYYNLSASAFADKIEVQRSSISHILSGRNKPSLDFVMKVLSSFPEVDLYWLLNGKGNFPSDKKSTAQDQKISSFPETIIKNVQSNTEIERIVIFFKDGGFKSYESN